MNKVLKYLMKECSGYSEATNTNSKYFKIGYVTIRYSDHIKEKMSYDINIVESYNTNEFLIFTTSGRTCVFNAKNAVQFIKDSLQYIELTKLPSKLTENEVNSEIGIGGTIMVQFNDPISYKKWVKLTFGSELFCGKTAFKLIKGKQIAESKLKNFIEELRKGASYQHASLQLQ